MKYSSREGKIQKLVKQHYDLGQLQKQGFIRKIGKTKGSVYAAK